MASVNRLVYFICFPILVISYGTYLYLDSKYYADNGNNAIIKSNFEHLSSGKIVDGLVIGGSNALFSLSAELMSKETGNNWFNASLLNEGYNNLSYETYLENISKVIAPNLVKTIVYSSISPYVIGSIKERTVVDEDVTGFHGLSLKPYRSVFSYLRQHIVENDNQPKSPYKVTKFGDLDFTEIKCEYSNSGKIKEREKIHIIATDMLIKLDRINKIFPNAKIYIIFPSELYWGGAINEDGFQNSIRIEFMRGFEAKHLSLKNFGGIVFQPAFRSLDLICDAPHHANAIGRSWRTSDLVTKLKSIM
jgi:hypothetical protein